MKHKYNRRKTQAVWDYNIKKLDFFDPAVMRWYLTRRIEWSDWKGLRKIDIRKHLPYLKLASGMKKLLSAVVNETD